MWFHSQVQMWSGLNGSEQATQRSSRIYFILLFYYTRFESTLLLLFFLNVKVKSSIWNPEQ